MNDLTSKLAGFRGYCESIRDQALILSGTTAGKLRAVSDEIDLTYGAWLTAPNPAAEDEPADAFTGFQKMLEEWKTPWPCTGGELDGKAIHQVLLAIAYSRAGTALTWIETSPAQDRQRWLDLNGATCLAIDAARFLDEAKHRIGAGTVDLIQRANLEECEQVM